MPVGMRPSLDLQRGSPKTNPLINPRDSNVRVEPQLPSWVGLIVVHSPMEISSKRLKKNIIVQMEGSYNIWGEKHGGYGDPLIQGPLHDSFTA